MMRRRWRLNGKYVITIEGDEPAMAGALPSEAELLADSKMLKERKRNLLVFLRRNMAAAIAHTLWDEDRFRSSFDEGGSGQT